MARLALRVLLVLVVVVACKSERDKKPSPTLEAPTAATADARPAVDAPESVTYAAQARMAVFFGGVLDECLDVTWTTDAAPARADAAKQWADDMVAKMHSSDENKKVVRVAKPCEEQFKDRTELASCRGVMPAPPKDVPAGVSVKISFVSRTYRFDAVAEGDQRMQECMEWGGDWQALDRNSAEFREARAHRNAANLQRTVDNLQPLTR